MWCNKAVVPGCSPLRFGSAELEVLNCVLAESGSFALGIQESTWPQLKPFNEVGFPMDTPAHFLKTTLP